MTLIPKHSPHRDRKLLDLAHELHECTNCDQYSAHGLEPAHSNASEDGKGVSQKSGDLFHAAICFACHRWYDERHDKPDPSGRWQPGEWQEMWNRAYKRTAQIYWTEGWVRVA